MISRHTKLSENFTLGEFLHTGVEPEDLPVYALENLTKLAKALQKIRDELKRPVIITSGYRTVAHNRKVGGAPRSQHLTGKAADIVVQGMSAKDVQKHLKDWPGGLGYGETFTHLDMRGYKVRFDY